jgi:RP/EB family microtubule-associated protein
MRFLAYDILSSLVVSRPSASASRPGTRVPANLNNQLDELNAQLLDSKLTIEGLEKERDFYFGKLRDIEVLCQEQESSEFSQKVLAVLYQTEVIHLNLIQSILAH